MTKNIRTHFCSKYIKGERHFTTWAEIKIRRGDVHLESYSLWGRNKGFRVCSNCLLIPSLWLKGSGNSPLLNI